MTIAQIDALSDKVYETLEELNKKIKARATGLPKHTAEVSGLCDGFEKLAQSLLTLEDIARERKETK